MPLHAALLFAGLTFAALSQGAFYGHQLTVLELVIAAAAAVSLARTRPRRPDWTRGRLGVAGAVVAPILMSGLVSRAGGFGVLQALFAMTLLAVVLLVERLTWEERNSLVTALLVLGVLVGTIGWLGVAFHLPSVATVSGGLWRASSTVTYANALAAFLVPLALLALARLTSRTTSRIDALLAFVLLAAVGATFSRGGLISLAVGTCVLAAVVGPRVLLQRTNLVVLAAGLAAIGLLASVDASGPARPGIALGGLALSGSALLVRRDRLSGALAASILAAAVLTVVLLFSRSDNLGARLAVDAGAADRSAMWNRFLDAGADHPLLGNGPRSFPTRYVRDRRDHEVDARAFAHNEYLQVWAEQGLVGLVCLAAVLMTVARSVARSRPDGREGQTFWAGASAGLAAVVVHAGLDFVWSVPLIAALAGALVGLATRPRVDHLDLV